MHRRVLFPVALAAAAALVLVLFRAEWPAAAAAQRVTCSSFPTQAAAQAAYRADPQGLATLDADRDGVACESNRCPCDRVPVNLNAPAPAPPPPAPVPPAPAPAAPAPPPSPAGPPAPVAPAFVLAPEGWTQVVNLVDGDTVDVAAPGGVGRVRFFGTDTPERAERCFADAIAALDRLLTDNGRAYNVYLEYGPRVSDQFGRTLAYVWIENVPGGGDWELVDWWMVWFGYARAWRGDGQYVDRIVAAEEDARANGRGCLWGG